jgi:hypothetical protein
MEYKLLLFVIVLLFIGANLFCSCCRYPIFDYMMGNTGLSLKEGNTNNDKNKDTGTPGSLEAVKAANQDIAKIMSKNQPVPPILNPPGVEGFDMGGIHTVFEQGLNVLQGSGKERFQEEVTEGLEMGGLQKVFDAGMNKVVDLISGPPPREEKITVSSRREGMATMGSNVNEIQNGDLASMWVSKANSYASKFGYTENSNSGSSYSAENPSNTGMLIFSKNKSKPECCPSPYSTSTGCICMTSEQIKYLNTRGGNRTTDSGI